MSVEGTIQYIIFRNAEDGFSIFSIDRNGKDTILVGSIPSLNVGEYIKAECKEKYDNRYGLEYQILNYTIELPKEKKGIIKFLSSEDFPGIGEVLATRLVDIYGDEIFKAIEERPDEVMLVKGMTQKRMKTIQNTINLKKIEVDLIVNLEQYELPLAMIRHIINKYKEETIRIINENPYLICKEIDGVGFPTSDKIALKNGIKEDSEIRIGASIIYVLEQAEYNEGDVYLFKSELNDVVKKLIKIDNLKIDEYLPNLMIENEIKIIKLQNEKEERIYLLENYNVEYNLTNLLFERKDNIKIITGGPGTGKTYNIKKYLKECMDNSLNVILCAPTGRAAKRMTEVTQYQAMTIHRMLQFGEGLVKDDDGSKTYFRINGLNKLECDVLIIDEASMIDMKLMYHLFKALFEDTKVLIVGDVDQLPSVGCGEVLKDMIKSGWFNVEILTTIYRQEEDSHIVTYSHEINKGNDVALDVQCEDFKFVHRYTDKNIQKAISDLVSDILPRHFKIQPIDIQVICPSRKKDCGTESLNVMLQDILNGKTKDKEEITIGERVFREGDKVMQIKNDYDIEWVVDKVDGTIGEIGYGVFNGDIGVIEEIDKYQNTVVVRFDDKKATYEKDMLDKLSLGYAITVHKSQGSEYDVVVVPMSYFHPKLLNRKILYTAMTRAKKCIIFIGFEEIFYTMIRNNYENNRHSSLCNQFYISKALCNM